MFLGGILTSHASFANPLPIPGKQTHGRTPSSDFIMSDTSLALLGELSSLTLTQPTKPDTPSTRAADKPAQPPVNPVQPPVNPAQHPINPAPAPASISQSGIQVMPSTPSSMNPSSLPEAQVNPPGKQQKKWYGDLPLYFPNCI